MDKMKLSTSIKFEATPREGKLPLLKGYAMTWNSLSDDRGGYKVRLLPNSAKYTGKILALYNHEYAMPLGNTDTGTLQMTTDDKGLAVVIDPPDTSYGRDVVTLVQRGDVCGMSFGMMYEGMVFCDKQEGAQKVREFSGFFFDEVTVTPIPAFTDTSIQAFNTMLKEETPIATPERNRLAIELDKLRLQEIAG